MSTRSPKVSVIAPMYNVEPYLVPCIESVINQTLQDIDLILVDDGSPDRSGAIADSYAARDSRIKVIHKENGGVSAARNDGLAEATGDYVFLLDSDDLLAPDALENMLEATHNGSYDVVLADYATFSGDPGTSARTYHVANAPFRSSDRDALDAVQLGVFNMGPANIESGDIRILRGTGAAWHYLIRRSLITDNSLRFDAALKGLFDDGCFSLDVLELASSIAYVQKVTYYYRYVPGSITRKFGAAPFGKYEAVYHAIERFIHEHGKGRRFERGLCLRKFIYLNKSMQTYFFHPANPAPESKRYREFLEVVRSPEYEGAARLVDGKALGCTRSGILLACLHMRFYWGYWMLKKLTAGRG